jgi:hypothetical protein
MMERIAPLSERSELLELAKYYAMDRKYGVS